MKPPYKRQRNTPVREAEGVHNPGAGPESEQDEYESDRPCYEGRRHHVRPQVAMVQVDHRRPRRHPGRRRAHWSRRGIDRSGGTRYGAFGEMSTELSPEKWSLVVRSCIKRACLRGPGLGAVCAIHGRQQPGVASGTAATCTPVAHLPMAHPLQLWPGQSCVCCLPRAPRGVPRFHGSVGNRSTGVDPTGQAQSRQGARAEFLDTERAPTPPGGPRACHH